MFYGKVSDMEPSFINGSRALIKDESIKQECCKIRLATYM